MSKVHGTRIINAGHYVIRAGIVAGKPKAFIFIGNQKVPDLEFAEADLDMTIVAAQKWISDEAIRIRSGRREIRSDRGSIEIPSEDEYRIFFRKIALGEHELAMLRFHASRVDATMTEIAAAAGWNDYGPANLHYGSLGIKIARELNMTLNRRDDRSEIGISAIGYGGESGDNGHYVLSMYPELLAAIRSEGIL